MNKTIRALLGCALLLVVVAPAAAQGSGIVQGGDDAVTVVGRLMAGWQGGGTACFGGTSTQATLTAVTTSGPCDWRQVQMVFDLPGDNLTVDHCWAIDFGCNTSGNPFMETNIDFQPTPIGCNPTECDNATCDFGEIVVTTSESAMPAAQGTFNVPTLGSRGLIGVAVGLLGIGVFFIVRRTA